MKVFNGADFLKSKTCTIDLSNGEHFVVKDLSDEAMDEITKINDSESTMASIRCTIAKAFKTDIKKLKGVGVVELQGALGFLSESLFDQK